MLTQLTIKNYALIDDLKVSFSGGFTTITGETGAGKSILLEGLALVLGNRADRTSLRDETRKCIIEAQFDIGAYSLESFFQTHDLDYEVQTLLRREIHPNGKSRAFVNDSPVTLDVLSELGKRLIDVHSQHQTLQLTEHDFQLRVVDALAENRVELAAYRELRKRYLATNRALEALLETQRTALKEQDYTAFLLEELEAARLKEGMQEALEEEHEQLSNVETIMEQLQAGYQLLNEEEVGINERLRELKQTASRLSRYGRQYAGWHERVQSVLIELDDLTDEFVSARDKVEADPALLEEVGARLQLLYDLLKKHQAADVAELIRIKNELAEKVATTLNLESDIRQKQEDLAKTQRELEEQAALLSRKRKAVLPELQRQLEEILRQLGMPNAAFSLDLHPVTDFQGHGRDSLVFLFSANKGGAFGELKKVASGGELSRIMLAIKSILVAYEPLPTMMFDEIDTGVSGEISNKMGDIMLQMSSKMQIFSITHLPQVASKGNHHFKVYKEDDGAVTHTRMRELRGEERIVELAEMLGGKALSDSAMAHARQLLH